MKWMVAGLAFAAIVGLAIATAAIQVENVRSRARIARLAERLDAARVGCEADRIRFREAARVDRLIALWHRFEDVLAERSGS
ncbi:MAG: hypothetical protein U1F36_02030 [Planctomycetota bacterium]